MIVLVFSLDFLCHFTWNGMENPSFYHSPRKICFTLLSFKKNVLSLQSRTNKFCRYLYVCEHKYHIINDSKRAHYECD